MIVKLQRYAGGGIPARLVAAREPGNAFLNRPVRSVVKVIPAPWTTRQLDNQTTKITRQPDNPTKKGWKRPEDTSTLKMIFLTPQYHEVHTGRLLTTTSTTAGRAGRRRATTWRSTAAGCGAARWAAGACRRHAAAGARRAARRVATAGRTAWGSRTGRRVATAGGVTTGTGPAWGSTTGTAWGSRTGRCSPAGWRSRRTNRGTAAVDAAGGGTTGRWRRARRLTAAGCPGGSRTGRPGSTAATGSGTAYSRLRGGARCSGPDPVSNGSSGSAGAGSSIPVADVRYVIGYVVTRTAESGGAVVGSVTETTVKTVAETTTVVGIAETTIPTVIAETIVPGIAPTVVPVVIAETVPGIISPVRVTETYVYKTRTESSANRTVVATGIVNEHGGTGVTESRVIVTGIYVIGIVVVETTERTTETTDTAAVLIIISIIIVIVATIGVGVIVVIVVSVVAVGR